MSLSIENVTARLNVALKPCLNDFRTEFTMLLVSPFCMKVALSVLRVRCRESGFKYLGLNILIFSKIVCMMCKFCKPSWLDTREWCRDESSNCYSYTMQYSLAL